MYTINSDFFGFDKKYNKFLQKNKSNSNKIKLNYTEILEKLKTTPRDTSFRRTHPLNGKMKGSWSVRIDYETASVLIYEVDDDNEIIYLKDIGLHSLYEEINLDFNNFIYEATRGTYAGFRLSEESKDKILKICKKLELVNPIQRDDIHITLLYSRKYLPDYNAPSQMPEQKIKTSELQLFGDCLVLLIDSEFIMKRHNHLMDIHQATFDYPNYQPHITLGYEVKELPSIKIQEEFIITEEYKEELNLDWKDRYIENE